MKKKFKINEEIKVGIELNENKIQIQKNKNRYFTNKDRFLLFYYNKPFCIPEYGIRKFT